MPDALGKFQEYRNKLYGFDPRRGPEPPPRGPEPPMAAPRSARPPLSNISPALSDAIRRSNNVWKENNTQLALALTKSRMEHRAKDVKINELRRQLLSRPSNRVSFSVATQTNPPTEPLPPPLSEPSATTVPEVEESTPSRPPTPELEPPTPEPEPEATPSRPSTPEPEPEPKPSRPLTPEPEPPTPKPRPEHPISLSDRPRRSTPHVSYIEPSLITKMRRS
ncbi:hypothetical protein M885DRAFT_504544 [Pelagophyceae sp. CCMP2097]|nr:hypothetical protein M885DRAFT_504544 [Pelagophyceae sp. CCMP2097]